MLAGMTTTPSYSLSVGDPQGIGPEITLKLLRHLLASDTPPPFTLQVFGGKQALEQAAKVLELEALVASDSPVSWWQWHWLSDAVNPSPGQQAVAAIEAGVKAIASGKAQGLVTGPINKATLWAAGYSYSGHTELLQDLAERHWPQPPEHAWRSEMLFLYRAFRLVLLTRHMPLSEVPKALTPEGLEATTNSLLAFLSRYCGLERPKLGVLGLNPHAGEIGGSEERELFVPHLEKLLSDKRLSAGQVLAADGHFRGFDPERPPFDAYLSPYHDQGLIPMKLLGGWETINVTIGLPFLRTSVSHGTADDIAGQGIASASSLIAALHTLDSLYQQGKP